MISTDPRVAFFDHLAPAWDAEEPSPQTMAQRLDQHAPLLNLTPGLALLEVGCGTGKTTPWLAAQVAPGRVTAIDFAPQMIAQARNKNIAADFACADVCRDYLGTARYDVILCFHSFPHFRDQPAALQNFARALKPAGRLLVMHLAGSHHINHFHANVHGPVQGDLLPAGDQWHALLAPAQLTLLTHIDQPDLFFLQAAPTPQSTIKTSP